MAASSQYRRKLVGGAPRLGDGRMYLVLLVFGVVIGAAGVVLTVSGVSLRDGTFDAAVLTPGIVALLGGLLLIGLGVGLRTLKRIEQALTSRPMPRVVGASDSPKSPEVSDTSTGPAPVAFASQATRESQPGAAAQVASEAESKAPAPDNDKASQPAPTIVLSALEANANADAQRAGKAGNGTAGLRLSTCTVCNSKRAAKRAGLRCVMAERTAPLARGPGHAGSDPDAGRGASSTAAKCCADRGGSISRKYSDISRK